MKNNLSKFSSENHHIRYLTRLIVMSEMPVWDTDPQNFIEVELNRMTEDGAEVVSVIRDPQNHKDLLVFLKVSAQGGAA